MELTSRRGTTPIPELPSLILPTLAIAGLARKSGTTPIPGDPTPMQPLFAATEPNAGDCPCGTLTTHLTSIIYPDGVDVVTCLPCISQGGPGGGPGPGGGSSPSGGTGGGGGTPARGPGPGSRDHVIVNVKQFNLAQLQAQNAISAQNSIHSALIWLSLILNTYGTINTNETIVNQIAAMLNTLKAFFSKDQQYIDFLEHNTPLDIRTDIQTVTNLMNNVSDLLTELRRGTLLPPPGLTYWQYYDEIEWLWEALGRLRGLLNSMLK
jgi:hypothetical protein